MLNEIIEQAIVMAFALATPVVVLAIHKLASKVAEKLGLDNANKYNEYINLLVEQAIRGVEKTAITMAKNNKTVKKGDEKLAEAIDWINGELTRLKLPTIDSDKLAVRIESELLKIERT